MFSRLSFPPPHNKERLACQTNLETLFIYLYSKNGHICDIPTNQVQFNTTGESPCNELIQQSDLSWEETAWKRIKTVIEGRDLDMTLSGE